MLTLPGWALVALVASVGLGLAVHRARRSRWFRGWIVIVGLTCLFEGTSLPHGAWAIGWYFDAPARRALEDLDLALSRIQREEVVRRAGAGLLDSSKAQYAEPEDYVLPEGFAGLTDRESLWVSRDTCGIKVFFRTITGFSPDPYGGFEYASPGCQPELDPLGSGFGIARDLGGGWYWIDAS